MKNNYPLTVHYKSLPPLSYDPNPPFGSVCTPAVLSFDIKRGESTPAEIKLEELGNLTFSPFTNALHYGQTIFEGMKAFRLDNNQVGIFRLEDHARRFHRSATLMDMTPIDVDLFNFCLKKYVDSVKEFVPTLKDHALYLRPFLMANDPVIKLQSGKNFKFLVMSSIVGDYFASGSTGSKILINKKLVRAFPGGTGEAKTAANYATSLNALTYAQSKGYEQVLYLDAMEHKYFEELGGMNVFFVREGKLITPPLNGQILKGITRESILEIVGHLGFELEQKIYSIDEFVADCEAGKISEVFACGTAAVVNPIAAIGVENENDEIRNFEFSTSEVALKIRKFLMATQKGETEFSKKWLTIV